MLLGENVFAVLQEIVTIGAEPIVMLFLEMYEDRVCHLHRIRLTMEAKIMTIVPIIMTNIGSNCHALEIYFFARCTEPSLTLHWHSYALAVNRDVLQGRREFCARRSAFLALAKTRYLDVVPRKQILSSIQESLQPLPICFV